MTPKKFEHGVIMSKMHEANARFEEVAEVLEGKFSQPYETPDQDLTKYRHVAKGAQRTVDHIQKRIDDATQRVRELNRHATRLANRARRARLIANIKLYAHAALAGLNAYRSYVLGALFLIVVYALATQYAGAAWRFIQEFVAAFMTEWSSVAPGLPVSS